MTVLVTGATGLVGNNVVRHLLSAKPVTPVRCLLREGADTRPLQDLPAERVTGDVTDAASVTRACEGVTAVIHCAALVHIGWTRAGEMQAVNEDGTRNMALAARKAGARLVHVSTTDTLRAGALRQIPYAASKIAAEAAVQAEIAEGLDAVIIRPAFLLGPNDWKPSSGRVLLAAATRWVPFAPRGGTSICDARDVAAAIVTAADRSSPPGTFVLSGYDMPWLEALRKFAAAGNNRQPICRFDPVAQRLFGLAGDIPPVFGMREPEVNSAAMLLAGGWLQLDSAPARSQLAYSIRPLEETIADSWNWFARNGFTK